MEIDGINYEMTKEEVVLTTLLHGFNKSLYIYI